MDPLNYISYLATCFGFLQNHLQVVFNYEEVHPVFAHIMGSHNNCEILFKCKINNRI
jgi:hypothetical protein